MTKPFTNTGSKSKEPCVRATRMAMLGVNNLGLARQEATHSTERPEALGASSLVIADRLPPTPSKR